jgi:hypothetical protein
MDIQKPTTITTSTGLELTKTTTAQGNIISDGTNDRILIGYQKAGFGTKDLGIKVSQEGYDVKTATDAQLVMSSAFNAFKIVLSGTVTLTVPDPMISHTTYTATIPHGLSTAPAFQAYVTVPSGWSGLNANQLTQLPTMLLDSDVATNGATLFAYVQGRCDSTNLYLDVMNPAETNQAGMGTSWVFKYYILQETAN